MIKQISSHDINQILFHAQAQLGQAESDLIEMKETLVNRLAIMDDEAIWHHKNKLDYAYLNETNYLSVPLYSNSDGVYSKYYCDVLPALVKEPLNVFNIPSTQTVFFRDDVTLTLHYPDQTTEDVTSILKHDSLKSSYFHKHFSHKNVKMVLEIADFQRPLGASRFNVIEIDGFMQGAFRLNTLTLIYDNETITYSDFHELGKNHLMLEEKKQIDRIEFDFELLNEVNTDYTTYYPFALKHIYLLEADFKSESYVIAKVETDAFISIIQNECLVSSNRGIEETTLEALGVEAYAHYADNQLYMPLTISNPYEIYEIPLQINYFFIKVPLVRSLSVIGMQVKTQ